MVEDSRGPDYPQKLQKLQKLEVPAEKVDAWGQPWAPPRPTLT